MAYLIEEKSLTNIADAIRAKTGSGDKMTPSQMVSAINSIETDGNIAPTMLTITCTFRSFTGYVVYNDGTSWKNKYSGAATFSLNVPEGSLVLICADSGASYYISSIRATSGSVTFEAIVQDESDNICTYVIPNNDCAIIVQGGW